MPGDLAGFQQMLNGYVGDLGEIQVWMSDPGPFRAGIAWILFCGNYSCVCVCVCGVCVCVCVCASVVALVVKKLPTNAGDLRDAGSIPGLGRYPGAGHGNLTYSSVPGESPGQRSLVGYSP